MKPACALTRNRTFKLLVHRKMLSQLKHTGQGNKCVCVVSLFSTEMFGIECHIFSLALFFSSCVFPFFIVAIGMVGRLIVCSYVHSCLSDPGHKNRVLESWRCFMICACQPALRALFVYCSTESKFRWLRPPAALSSQRLQLWP